jgi:hypothetical protein
MNMNLTAFLILTFLIGFDLLMIYLLIGGYDELLSPENAFEGDETLLDVESGEGLYDGKFAIDSCASDPCDCQHGGGCSSRTDLQGAKKHPRVPRCTWGKVRMIDPDNGEVAEVKRIKLKPMERL